MKHFIYKKTIVLSLVFLLLCLCFVFRIKILRETGQFLISEDELQKAEAMFVLGGDSYDRGNLAADLYRKGFSGKIVCLGENIPTVFRALGISYSESEVTEINIEMSFKNPENPITSDTGNSGVDSSVVILKKGTSTMEEVESILAFCNAYNLKKVIIISSKFHTRRIRMVCEKILKNTGIEFIIAGAPSSIYSEEEWWKSEEGLIMLNNEYVKLFYYLLKY